MYDYLVLPLNHCTVDHFVGISKKCREQLFFKFFYYFFFNLPFPVANNEHGRVRLLQGEEGPEREARLEAGGGGEGQVRKLIQFYSISHKKSLNIGKDKGKRRRSRSGSGDRGRRRRG